MSQAVLKAHYLPNWKLSQAFGFAAYNCGLAESGDTGSFADHQQRLVWRLLSDTPIDDRTTFLDVGSGIGGPTAWIHERYGPARMIGVEYCESSVQVARERWAHGRRPPVFLQADAHALPIADKSVDVIFNLESALHYVNKPAFLAECRRVLRNGGTLCLGDITTPHKLLFASLRLFNRLPSQFNSSARLWSSTDYQKAIPAAGFRSVRHEDVSGAVAESLSRGLEEVRKLSWHESKGFRGRVLYLAMLEKLLRKRTLRYVLFQAVA
jgi:ubiquinone/menaquinone biosynthesis C-methylase UbiE